MRVRYIQHIIFVALMVVFVVSRLWGISSSYHFVGDVGRDMWELFEWQQTFKPPLLGPQNSAIAFNQSAWYFYLLYPAYILSGQSVFSPIYTGVGFYLLALLGSYALLGKRSELRWIPILMAAVVGFHPEILTQTRSIWNPSFTAPALILAISGWVALEKRLSNTYAKWIYGGGLAASIGFSFATLPLALVFLGRDLYRRSFERVRAFLVSVGVVFAPTIVFYARYPVHLSRVFEMGLSESANQHTVIGRMNAMAYYVMSIGDYSPLLAMLIILTMVGALIWYQKLKAQPLGRSLIAIALTSLLLYVVLPITFFPHYVFAPLIILMVGVYFLPRLLRLGIFGVFVVGWMQLISGLGLYESAPRTVKETFACVEQVCVEQDESMFVSVTSFYHPYHTGEDFRYVFAQSGCDVKRIEEDPSLASTMFVVADGSDYVHGESVFDELSRFGKARESTVVRCSEEFSLHQLDRLE